MLKASETLLILLDGLLNEYLTGCSISPVRVGKMGWNNHLEMETIFESPLDNAVFSKVPVTQFWFDTVCTPVDVLVKLYETKEKMLVNIRKARRKSNKKRRTLIAIKALPI